MKLGKKKKKKIKITIKENRGKGFGDICSWCEYQFNVQPMPFMVRKPFNLVPMIVRKSSAYQSLV